MRIRLVLGMLGAILRPASALFLLPLVLDLVDGNRSGAVSFAIGTGVCLGAGFLLGRLPRPLPSLQRSEALAVAGLSFLLMSAVSAVPFVVQGFSFVDGLFEAMSGYTTTGASIVVDYDMPGRGFFLWRAITNWVGGVGVVSLFVLVLPGLGVGGRQLFFAQSAATPGELLSPQIRRMARNLILVYAGLTLAESVLLGFAGMSAYDAVLHSMATLATGGFSPNEASIAGYANPAVEVIVTVFMVAGGSSLVLLALAFRLGVRELFRDREFLAYTGYLLVLSLGVACLLAGGMPGLRDLRTAAFNVVSLGTTTGFASADFDQWNDATRSLLIVAAVLGGCAASTAGGAKIVRLLVSGNFLRREMVHALHPSAVVPVRYKGAVVSTQILRAVVAVVLLYVVGYLVVGTILVLMGADIITGYSAAVACLNNVGPGLAKVGPMANYAWMSDASKLVLIATMWLGRLEIVAVLAVLRPDAWRGTRWSVEPPVRGPSPVHA